MSIVLTGNKCWMCGVTIANPKYFVTERLLDYGVYEGRKQMTPIHKKCYETAGAEITSFFINGLENFDEVLTYPIREDQACQGFSCGAAPLGCSYPRYCPRK